MAMNQGFWKQVAQKVHNTHCSDINCNGIPSKADYSFARVVILLIQQVATITPHDPPEDWVIRDE